MIYSHASSYRCSTFSCRSFVSAGPTLLQSGIHCLTICAIQLLGQIIFDGTWNPPVCLLLAFRWQCVRDVFMYSRYTNVHLLTYLPKILYSIWRVNSSMSCEVTKQMTRCLESDGQWAHTMHKGVRYKQQHADQKYSQSNFIFIAVLSETTAAVSVNTDCNIKHHNHANSVSPVRCCAKGSLTFTAKTFQSVSPETSQSPHTI